MSPSIALGWAAWEWLPGCSCPHPMVDGGMWGCILPLLSLALPEQPVFMEDYAGDVNAQERAIESCDGWGHTSPKLPTAIRLPHGAPGTLPSLSAGSREPNEVTSVTLCHGAVL